MYSISWAKASYVVCDVSDIVLLPRSSGSTCGDCLLGKEGLESSVELSKLSC